MLNTRSTQASPIPSSPDDPNLGMRSLLPLYLAVIAVGMGQTVVFAMIPMLGRELGLDQIAISWPGSSSTWVLGELGITSLSACTAFIFFICTPRWGRVSDRWGRKPVIIVGLLGYSLGTLIFNGIAELGLRGITAGAALFGALLLSRVLHASLMSASHPAASAYMVDITSVNERTVGVGRLAACNQIGTLIGPSLAGFAVFSLLMPLYIQAALMAGLAVLVAVALPASPVQPAGPGGKRALRFLDRRYAAYIGIAITLFSMLGMVQQTLGFYFQDVLQLTAIEAAQQFSLAMMVSAAATLVAQFGIVQRYKGQATGLLLLGLPLTFCGYLCLAMASAQWMLITGMALFGVGMGLTGPGYTAAATLTVEPAEQGNLAGLLAASAGLGFVIGPLLGGWLYGFSPHLPYALAAIGLWPIFFFVLVIRKRLVKK